jgi:hypothetical protein
MSALNAGINGAGSVSKTTSDSKFGRFWLLVTGLMFFFGCHNFLQELIMSLPGFKVMTIFHDNLTVDTIKAAFSVIVTDIARFRS